MKKLATHKQEYCINGKGRMRDGEKIWNNTELESSKFFGVLKEINNNVSWILGALKMKRKLKEHPQKDIRRLFNG